MFNKKLRRTILTEKDIKTNRNLSQVTVVFPFCNVEVLETLLYLIRSNFDINEQKEANNNFDIYGSNVLHIANHLNHKQVESFLLLLTFT